jgi:hypothetical protein
MRLSCAMPFPQYKATTPLRSLAFLQQLATLEVADRRFRPPRYSRSQMLEIYFFSPKALIRLHVKPVDREKAAISPIPYS